MAFHFEPKHTTIFRVILLAAAGLPVLAIFLVWWLARTPLGTFQENPVEQPVDFDHRHHAGDDGIDCRYCHQTVETSSWAGFPSTSTCLNCHNQIWNRAGILSQVRASYFQDEPIRWRKVNRLPQYVYFDHSIHVNKGIGCASCHGRVDLMAAVRQAAPLTMGWCLDCHRQPAKNLRPLSEITNMSWQPPPGPEGKALQAKLLHQYDVKPRTSCSTCHR